MARVWSARLTMRDWLAEVLPRWLALALGIRRVVPTPDGYWPWRSVVVPDLDTGGGFRAAWRQQDPSVDPKEPGGGESSSAGNDHGWANCTMTSGALALAYQQPRGSLAPWGGDLRHKQGDLSGGTDLYDVRDAWKAYGETLTIKSGAGWSAVKTAHNEGRAIVIQGTGNVPGSESFDGGHGCCIAPETHSDGRWLFGDPLASGWQWVKPSDIEVWAERWQSSVAFAVGEKPPPPPPAEPDCPDCPDCPPCPDPAPLVEYASALAVELDDDVDVRVWVDWLRAGKPKPSDVWDVGGWGPTEVTLADLEEGCGGTPPLVGGARWHRGRLPDPVWSAYHALTTEPRWDDSPWRGALWA